jgi:trimeric autotransporter adhesin
MRAIGSILLLLSAALCGTGTAAEFTYRGQLEDGSEPAHGRYALRLQMFPVAQGGAALAPAVELTRVEVLDGRFVVPVEIPALPAPLEAAWLEVAVQAAGDPNWWPLPGRERVELKAATCPAAWELGGNLLTSPGQDFVGTLDFTALELRVDGRPALRIEPVDFVRDERRFDVPNVRLGGELNRIDALSSGSIIAGGGGMSFRGFLQPNEMSAQDSFIGSGSGNIVAPISGPFPQLAPVNNAALVGGLENVVRGNGAFIGAGFFGTASGATSVVAGGFENSASGSRSAVLGGEANVASGTSAAVPGGLFNTAAGAFSVVPGGANSTAGGDFSFAAGRRAKVRTLQQTGDDPSCSNDRSCGDEGSFVWADAQNADLSSSGPNQFIARAAGGFWLGSNSTPSFVAGRLINTSTGAHLTTGGTWTNGSSRALKEGFLPVDAAAVLAGVLDLPLLRWRYRDSPQEGEHLGPMAEDFAARFGLGAGSEAISTVDADGVALAAIQGLNAKLEAENAALRERLDRLESLLQELADRDQTASRPEAIRP